MFLCPNSGLSMAIAYRGQVNLFEKMSRAYRKGGLSLLFYKVVSVAYRPLKERYLYMRFRFFPPLRGSFLFNGVEHRYFYHRYNATWRNERAVEVPIIYRIVEQSKDKNILEVGNVLKNYYPLKHTVLDKYELVPGVINEDVVDFRPKQKFDLIFSISTFEHVGWDEDPREPEKVLQAFKNLLENCLVPNGLLIVTLPIGYNPALDEFINRGKLRFDKQYFLKRDRGNEWIEVSRQEAYGTAFNWKIPTANAVLIGFLRNKIN